VLRISGAKISNIGSLWNPKKLLDTIQQGGYIHMYIPLYIMELKMLEHFLWVEKYRPHTIADTILPIDLKTIFQKFVDDKNLPNMTLFGGPGIGKTTVARAILEEIDCDYIVINGSLNGNIDTLRNDIANFASSMSFNGTRKYVILDEADYLNPNSTQPALRNFMEEFSKNCGFILTCNNKNRIIPALQSRAPVVEFNIKKDEMPKIAMQFMKRAEFILNAENVSYDKKVLSVVITKHFPDWRRILNELQRYSATGAIDNGILSRFQEVPIKEVINLCKNKEFDALRKWTAENTDIDQNDVFSMIYEYSDSSFSKRSIPVLILKIAEYQYKGSFVANQELNLLAFFVEIIRECEFL